MHNKKSCFGTRNRSLTMCHIGVVMTHWSGRPVSVANETVKQQVEQRICDSRRDTIDEIAVELNMSHGSAYSFVHDDLGYRKVCSRWVPSQLSDIYVYEARSGF
jgi:hypothetical protein